MLEGAGLNEFSFDTSAGKSAIGTALCKGVCGGLLRPPVLRVSESAAGKSAIGLRRGIDRDRDGVRHHSRRAPRLPPPFGCCDLWHSVAM